MNQKIYKYVELTKPRVTLLNLLVGATCFVLAVFPSINLIKLAVFALAGYLACGGCGALNCALDRNLDRLMQRTSRRAIPSGVVSPRNALLFGSVLVATGICLSWLAFNALTAIMMASGAAFYLLIYTAWLKPRSSLNVIIGGTAGCFAALSGWTAASNGLSLLPLLISIVDFLWTPGHLWGLAIKKVKEYKTAGIPMLPAKVGIRKASLITFLFNSSAIGCCLVLPILGVSGGLYCLILLPTGFWFMLENLKLLKSPSENEGFKVFSASMGYLAILMMGLLADRMFFVRFP